MLNTQWRSELNVIDSLLVTLLNRRVHLAVEMLKVLRSETLTLADAEQDGDALLVMLLTETRKARSPLDDLALGKVFRRINIESRRLAMSAIAQEQV